MCHLLFRTFLSLLIFKRHLWKRKKNSNQLIFSHLDVWQRNIDDLQHAKPVVPCSNDRQYSIRCYNTLPNRCIGQSFSVHSLRENLVPIFDSRCKAHFHSRSLVSHSTQFQFNCLLFDVDTVQADFVVC